MRRWILLCALGAACSFDTRVLLPTWDGAEFAGVQVVSLNEDLGAADPGETPDIDPADPYIGHLGPSDVGAGEYAGATWDFYGTGDRVCVIVDPEGVFRDDRQLGGDGLEYDNPYFDDYPYDDGDIDIAVGEAAWYTGTPGERMGDFFARFPDDNGIDRAVDLNVCLMEDYFGVVGGHAGRGSPEWCDFETTPGVLYRVALTVFATPMDDNDLRYAFAVVPGACPTEIDECTLRNDVPYDEDAAQVFPGEDVYNAEGMYCDALP